MTIHETPNIDAEQMLRLLDGFGKLASEFPESEALAYASTSIDPVRDLETGWWKDQLIPEYTSGCLSPAGVVLAFANLMYPDVDKRVGAVANRLNLALNGKAGQPIVTYVNPDAAMGRFMFDSRHSGVLGADVDLWLPSGYSGVDCRLPFVNRHLQPTARYLEPVAIGVTEIVNLLDHALEKSVVLQGPREELAKNEVLKRRLGKVSVIGRIINDIPGGAPDELSMHPKLLSERDALIATIMPLFEESISRHRTARSCAELLPRLAAIAEPEAQFALGILIEQGYWDQADLATIAAKMKHGWVVYEDMTHGEKEGAEARAFLKNEAEILEAERNNMIKKGQVA